MVEVKRKKNYNIKKLNLEVFLCITKTEMLKI